MEKFRATTRSQDPPGAEVAEAPPSVAGEAIRLHPGSINRLTLQRLHWITPQAHNLHDRLRIRSIDSPTRITLENAGVDGFRIV